MQGEGVPQVDGDLVLQLPDAKKITTSEGDAPTGQPNLDRTLIDELNSKPPAKYSELWKAIFTMVLWNSFGVWAIWSRGLVLSIAAALTGLQFGTLVTMATTDVKFVREMSQVTMGNTPLLGGLIIASSASANRYDGVAITFSVFAGLGLCSAFSFFSQRNELRQFMKMAEELEKGRKEEVKARGDGEEKLEDKDEKGQFTEMIQGPGEVVLALILIIVGTCLHSSKMAGKLCCLGVGFAMNLCGIMKVSALEEETESRTIFEGIFFICKLTAEIMPIALELSIEEDVDNPNVLTALAWTSWGMVLCVRIVFAISLWEAEEDKAKENTPTHAASQA